MAAHLFAFVLLPLRHVPAAQVASFQPPSSLLCIAHFYIFTQKDMEESKTDGEFGALEDQRKKTPHTAKIVMKFLLYDKVKYFYQHFSLVAFGA